MAPDADATAGASQGWYDLEAVLAEEPAATLLAAYLVPDLREAVEPLLQRVLDGETITGVEVSGATAKLPGVQRDWVEQLYPLRDPATQEVVGVGVVCEEVTDRKR